MAPLITVFEFPPTLRVLPERLAAPDIVRVPVSDCSRVVPLAVRAPVKVLLPETFSMAPAKLVPVLAKLSALATVTLLET